MIYLKTFKLSDIRNKNKNIYPFNVLEDKEPQIFIFDNITVLYGNNGSGKIEYSFAHLGPVLFYSGER